MNSLFLIDVQTWYFLDYFSLELCFVGFFLLFCGWFGFFLQLYFRNILFLFIYLELITLGLSILSIDFGLLYGDPRGFFIAIFLLVLAGVETVLGLSFIIVLSFLAQKKEIKFSFLNKTQG